MNAPAAVVVALVALTGTAAYLLGRRRGLVAKALGPALGRCLECLGLWALFYLVNVGLGVGATLLLRVLHGPFVSVYWFADITLLVLSALEALVFQSWSDPAHGSG